MFKFTTAVSRRVAWCVSTGFCLVLLGCASLPPTITYDHNSNATIKTIAVLTPAMPEQPLVFSAAGVSPFMLFGAVGGLIDAKIQENREDEWAKQLATKGFSAKDLLLTNVTAQLQAEGYNVVSQAAERPKIEFLKQYPKPASSADAYLDIIVASYGYLAGAITAPYHPVLGIQYRLVRISDNKTLMQGAFGYSISDKDVHPDPLYDFKSYDEIKSDPDRAIKGVSVGVDLGASAVSTALH